MLFLNLAVRPVRDPTTPGNTDMLATMEEAWATEGWDGCEGRQNPRDWWYDYDGCDETYPTDQHVDLWDTLLAAREHMPPQIYTEWQAFIERIQTDFRQHFVPEDHKTHTYERLTTLFKNWKDL